MKPLDSLSSARKVCHWLCQRRPAHNRRPTLAEPVALAQIMGVAIVAIIAGLAQAQPRSVSVRVDFQQQQGPLEIDRMGLGQGGLSDEPMWDSRVAEIRALRPRLIRLFVQEYFQLMPETGRYHFDTLDRSVQTILRTGAKPLFPTVNHDVVEPTDYRQWQQLIEQLVSHYRRQGAGIRYWEVANEPDLGETGGCPYRFTPESYVRYYRHTAAAILRADPQALIGGPAVASVRSPILPALLDACEKEKLPLAFVSWHIYSSRPGQIRETIEYAKSLLKSRPSLHPETMLNEWNMDLGQPPADPRIQPCYIAETIWQMKQAGLDWSCYYHIRDYHVREEHFAPFFSPGGVVFMAKWWNRMPQFDGLFDFQDRVRPSYFVFKLLSRMTGRQASLTSSDGAVHGFAAFDPRERIANVLLWNFSEKPAEVELALEQIPYDALVREATLDARGPSDDENSRIRPEPQTRLKKGSHRRKTSLEAYGMKFWSLE